MTDAETPAPEVDHAVPAVPEPAPLAHEPDVAHVDAPAATLGIHVADGVAHLGADSIGYGEDCALMIGRDLQQAGFAGLATQPGFVHVGPCHAAYAAINIAYQHGAHTVTVDGLSEAEKTLLSPWIAEIEASIAVQIL